MINVVVLEGRITKDIQIRYTQGQNPLAVANFSLAVDRPRRAGQQESQTDFPRIKAFGKLAENCEKYTGKGKRVIVRGKVQTASYEDKETKKTVYTTEIVADEIQFIDWNQQTAVEAQPGPIPEENPAEAIIVAEAEDDEF